MCASAGVSVSVNVNVNVNVSANVADQTRLDCTNDRRDWMKLEMSVRNDHHGDHEESEREVLQV